jgi:hypothetical protein
MKLLRTIHKELEEVKSGGAKLTKTGSGSILMNRLGQGMMTKVSGQTAMQSLFKDKLAQQFSERKE